MDRSTLIPVDWKFEYHILTLHKQKYVEANSSKRKPLQMIIVSPKPPALDGKHQCKTRAKPVSDPFEKLSNKNRFFNLGKTTWAHWNTKAASTLANKRGEQVLAQKVSKRLLINSVTCWIALNFESFANCCFLCCIYCCYHTRNLKSLLPVSLQHTSKKFRIIIRDIQ